MATFLICHGAWSAGWAWKKVRPLLSAAGHDVFTPSYTGLGERADHIARSVDLDTHIGDVLAVLHYEDLKNVVLVGHSYGGMVATGVADRAPDRISQLIYVDAFVPTNGKSLFDLLPENVRNQRENSIHGDGWLVPPPPPPEDTSAEDLEWIMPRRRWHPLRCFRQPISLANEKPVPDRTYIYCTRTGPDDRFGQFAQRAKSEAGWKYYEIDASHSPNVTAPNALAELFEMAIQ